MKLKYIVFLLYLLVSLPLFLFLKIEVTVWISFFVNYMLITIISYYHLNIEKTFSPFLSSYIVFVYLFFLVAPMIQIDAMSLGSSKFPNNFPYNSYEVIYTNGLIFIFNMLFYAFYMFFKKRVFKKQMTNESTSKHYSTPFLIVLLLLVCVTIGYFNYDFIIDEFQRSTYRKSGESVSSLLIRKKVLFFVPLGAIVIAHTYLKRQKRITNNVILIFACLIIFLVILILFKNPLIEKRNALGPIYITLIFIFTPKLINNNSKFFLFMFISMVLLFPFASAFTHVDATFQELVNNPKIVIDFFVQSGGITRVFSTLHYDAFPNILATVDYVSNFGFSYGYQLLSALLFFVPRSFWAEKPNSTGEMIGNYLIDDYGFVYSNLSNPIVSEGYVNFGLLGLMIMAILLAYFICKFIFWLNSSDKLKATIAFYFSVHLIFLLRGDFTNGFSYFIGAIVGIVLIPRLIDKFISFSQKKSKVN